MPTLKESTFNGTNGSHFKLRLDYSYTQDTSTNKTTITYSNYFISMDGYSGSGASNSVTAYVNGSVVGRTNSIGVNQTKLLGTKVVEITHNNDGTFPNTNYSASIQTGWSLGEANVSGTLTSSQIPKINRYPILLTAPNFNDEENPTITYSTDVGFEDARTLAYIGRLDWTGIIPSREINISSGSYTFELTNEERELLRNETPNSNTLDVLFLIVTQAGGNNYWSTMRRTLTIVNGNPTINSVSITEQNANVVSILGGTQTNYVIENTSELLFSISASAIKGASISSVLVNGQSATLQNNAYQVTLSNVQTGTFNIVATDTRTNTNSDTETKTLIQYMPVNINSYSFKRLNPTSSIIRLTADITCFSGSFNQTQNVPTIQYKVGESGTYTTISSGYTFTNNKITFTNYSLGEVLPYNQQDRLYLKVSDLLTDDQEYVLVLKGIPTYDAGEHDLKVNGDLYVADQYGNNKINVIDRLVNKGRYVVNRSETSNQTTTSTSDTQITGMSITMTTYGGDVLITATLPISVSTRTLSVELYVDSTRYGNMIVSNFTSKEMTTSQILVTSLASGSHTFDLKFHVQTNGDTGTIHNYCTKSMSAIEL